MKKIVRAVSLIISLLMLASILTACHTPSLPQDNDGGEGSGSNSESGNVNPEIPVIEGYEEFEGHPYLLTYRTNGDGTCGVSDIRINPNYREDFDLVIPERSPAGDLVTGLSMSYYSGYHSENQNGNRFLHFDPMPYMLTEKDFLELQDMMHEKSQSGVIDSWTISYISNRYRRISYAEETSASMKAYLLQKYPYAESFDFYVLHNPEPLSALYLGSILSQLGYTVEDLAEDEANFRFAVEGSTFDRKETVLQRLPFITDRLSTYITGIQIPQSVTEIGDYAFAGCERVQTISLPNGLTRIGNYAFFGCTELLRLDIPQGVTYIGQGAFAECSLLQSVSLPQGISAIGDDTFYDCVNLRDLEIPEGVTVVGGYAFYNCISLRQKEGGLYYVGNWLVDTANQEITSAAVRADCVGIAADAFAHCQFLKTVTIPEGVKSIGESAFHQCESLVSITIPSSVTYIGYYVFSSCTRLMEIYNLSSVNLRVGTGWYHINSDFVVIHTSADAESALWTNSDGITFFENGDGCYLVDYTGTAVKLTLPESYNGKNYSISPHAFSNATNLARISIPGGVTSIGEYAFYNCKNLDSIILPEGVTSISSSAFSKCTDLASIVIPSTVTFIGSYAFDDINRPLKAYYGGTEDEWNRIDIREEVGLPKIIYFYSETRPAYGGHYWHFVNGVPTVWNP